MYLVYHLKYYFKWRFLYAISLPPLHIEKIQSAIKKNHYVVIFHKKKIALIYHNNTLKNPFKSLPNQTFLDVRKFRHLTLHLDTNTCTAIFFYTMFKNIELYLLFFSYIRVKNILHWYLESKSWLSYFFPKEKFSQSTFLNEKNNQ